MKSCQSAPSIKAQLVKFEKQICDSHLSEKLFEEKVAVTKIKEDPNYFFRYAKKLVFVKLILAPFWTVPQTLWSMINMKCVAY